MEIRKEDLGKGVSTNYLTDAAVDSLARRANDIPLFSSFSPDYVFKPPDLTAPSRHRDISTSASRLADAHHRLAGAASSASAARRALEPPKKMQVSATLNPKP